MREGERKHGVKWVVEHRRIGVKWGEVGPAVCDRRSSGVDYILELFV